MDAEVADAEDAVDADVEAEADDADAEDDALEDAADDDADVEDDADADEDEFKTLEFKASAVWMTSALISDV